MIAKVHITEGLRSNGERLKLPIDAQADIHLFGQEVNPETWAVSKSDFFMKDPSGPDADNVAFGVRWRRSRPHSHHSICIGLRLGGWGAGSAFVVNIVKTQGRPRR